MNMDREYREVYSECDHMMIGYAYVRNQNLDSVYEEDAGLQNGTIFPELNIPMGEYEKGANS